MSAIPRELTLDIPKADSNASGLAVKIIQNSSQSVNIPDHKVQLLRKIGNAQSELGRLNKLLDEIRADILASK